jgi:hypothetical protein
VADHHAYKAERRLDNERLAAGRKDGYAADFCERAQKFLPAVVTGRSRIRPPSGVVLPDAFGAEKTAERGGRRGESKKQGGDKDASSSSSLVTGEAPLPPPLPELSYLANAEIKVVGERQNELWRTRHAGALRFAKSTEGTAKNYESPVRPRSVLREALLAGGSRHPTYGVCYLSGLKEYRRRVDVEAARAENPTLCSQVEDSPQDKKLSTPLRDDDRVFDSNGIWSNSRGSSMTSNTAITTSRTEASTPDAPRLKKSPSDYEPQCSPEDFGESTGSHEFQRLGTPAISSWREESGRGVSTEDNSADEEEAANANDSQPRSRAATPAPFSVRGNSPIRRGGRQSRNVKPYKNEDGTNKTRESRMDGRKLIQVPQMPAFQMHQF